MKYTIQWLLVLLTVFNPILSNAALTDFDRQEIAFKNWLAPYNSGFESGKAKWTASGGTFTAVTSGSNLLVGKGSATFDGSSASQTLTSQTITIEKGYYGQNCEAAIVAQVPSGTATHTVQAYDGTNILVSATIVSSTTPRLNTVNFPCPQSGTVALRLVTVASDEPLIAVDDAYLGLARNVGSTQLISEWTSYTLTVGATTTAPTKGTTSVDQARWRRVGDSMEIRYQYKQTGAGAAGSGTYKFPLPSGYSIDTSKVSASAGSDNATPAVGESAIYCTDFSPGAGVVQAFDSSNLWIFGVNQTASTNVGSTDCGLDNATVQIGFTAVVPIVGWTAQTVVMPNAQGWYVDANISGANPSLGTSNVSSYTEITNGSLTMTPRTGSAAAGIMCSSTNAAATPTTSTSTCSAGSESLGLNAVIPVSGAYEVCADFSHYMEADQAEGINTAFQIVQTPTNAQTITTEGGSRKSGRNAPLAIATGTAQAINVPYTVCGIFQLSAGTNGFRLMYEQLVTGTPNGSEVLADELSTVGQRNLRFTIKPINSQQQAILANSVSTSATNGAYDNSVQIGSTGTTSKETGDWVSGSCSVASAVYTCTLVAGAFSTDPACHATIFGETTSYNAVVTSASTSSVVVRTFDTANAAAAAAFALTCSGPR